MCIYVYINVLHNAVCWLIKMATKIRLELDLSDCSSLHFQSCLRLVRSEI